MSDLYRSAMQARIARLPPPHEPYEEGDEAEEEANSIGDLPSKLGSTHAYVSDPNAKHFWWKLPHTAVMCFILASAFLRAGHS